jgi:hypothetical protein
MSILRIKQLAFLLYVSLWSCYLYFIVKGGTLVWVYLQVSFPVGALFLFEVLFRQKDELSFDMSIAFDKISPMVGRVVLSVCLLPLLFTLFASFWAPYMVLAYFYVQMGVSSNIAFFLSLTTPVFLAIVVLRLRRKINK